MPTYRKSFAHAKFTYLQPILLSRIPSSSLAQFSVKAHLVNSYIVSKFISSYYYTDSFARH
jgi:hypothetical protein